MPIDPRSAALAVVQSYTIAWLIEVAEDHCRSAQWWGRLAKWLPIWPGCLWRRCLIEAVNHQRIANAAIRRIRAIHASRSATRA